ncbi:MAG: biotin synthase BioB [Planctomycetota bacterium]|nr:biotin synthase BioB [Planctomycetota bacterium]
MATAEKSSQASSSIDFSQLANQVVGGYQLTKSEAEQLLKTPDDQVLDLLASAYTLRRTFFGKSVQLYFLMNAKSGLCPEDCSYCSQSKVSEAPVEKYNILDRESLLDGARVAAERQSKTYCMVISARGPSEREIKTVEEIVPLIKEKFDLKICACLGLLDQEKADRLKKCGVDRVNHNLNTSGEYYESICSTHTYGDRIETLQAVRAAGMEICSGGIIGMGEKNSDIVDMAFDLRELKAESIPVNFLNAIEGTPLQNINYLTPNFCLKVLSMFRFVNPKSEIRISGGREIHLRSLQPLGLYAANSIFVGDYLTTQGQPPESDYSMIKDLGFEITKEEQVGQALKQETCQDESLGDR